MEILNIIIIVVNKEIYTNNLYIIIIVIFSIIFVCNYVYVYNIIYVIKYLCVWFVFVTIYNNKIIKKQSINIYRHGCRSIFIIIYYSFTSFTIYIKYNYSTYQQHHHIESQCTKHLLSLILYCRREKVLLDIYRNNCMRDIV